MAKIMKHTVSSVTYSGNDDKQLYVWTGRTHYLILTTKDEEEALAKMKSINQAAEQHAVNRLGKFAAKLAIHRDMLKTLESTLEKEALLKSAANIREMLQLSEDETTT